jgi:hypothetical protein
MQPHKIGRDVSHDVVECFKIGHRPAPELLERSVRKKATATCSEIGTIYLEQQTSLRDRVLFLLHRLSQREDIRFVAGVVPILEKA